MATQAVVVSITLPSTQHGAVRRSDWLMENDGLDSLKWQAIGGKQIQCVAIISNV